MNKSFKTHKQIGASLVLTVMMTTVLLGFFALAIDVGYLFVMRNQLQNAADTAALSGANSLYPLVSSNPNWSLASSKATTAVQQNRADNSVLASGTIITGYWNITGSPTGLHASKVDVNNDYPAVEVTITKSGINGVVNAFFSGVLGIKTFSPSATAVAVAGISPSSTKENILPFVIQGCVFGLGANGSGKIINPVGEYQIDRPYGPTGSTCNTGQWTPLQATKDQSDKTIQNIIAALSAGGTSSKTFSIGDELFLQSGTKANLYNLLGDCSVAGNGKCGYVRAAITCPITGSCDTDVTNVVQKIVGFACVKVVDSSGKGNPKTITFQVVPQTDPNYKINCSMHDSSGIGPQGGATIPPKIVNYSGNIY